jgi:hypothetical protein
MFLGDSPVKPFYFIPFGTKRLQTTPEAGEEALPNGAKYIRMHGMSTTTMRR